MAQSPEQAAVERMERNHDAEQFVIASRGARIEPTLPEFQKHLRRKKAVASVQPVKIIDGEGDGDDDDVDE